MRIAALLESDLLFPFQKRQESFLKKPALIINEEATTDCASKITIRVPSFIKQCLQCPVQQPAAILLAI